MPQKKISIIAACYNEEKSIPKLYERVKKVFSKLNYDFEIIYADNDSQDNSISEYKKLTRLDKRVKVLLMSRNFGTPQSSFLAGMRHAKGDAVIVMDGDIQDPPELFPKLIEKWERGFKVVYGIREKREGISFFYKVLYKLFYFVLNKLSYVKLPLNAGEFSLMDKKIIEELLEFGESEYYLRCLRAYVGYEQTGIKYSRQPRKDGKPDTNFRKSLWFAKVIIINFSFKPLSYISQIAFIVVLLTILLIVANIFMYFAFENSPPGIPTIVFLILFLGAIQLLSLSVIGEYLARIYIEVKKRPRYIIKKGINIGKVIKDNHY